MCQNPGPGTPSTPLSKPPFHLHLRLSISPDSLALPLLLLLHIRASLSVATSLSLISAPLFPSSPLLAFTSPSSLSAAASWCCSHFSSPEAHSQVWGNVWLYLYGASILLDSYCFGTEVPHSKFIKGQFNSKFMKQASVKVPAPMRFVCSQGASRMHRRPSVTPVPFPSLIRNYWVVSFSSILDFIKKRPCCFFLLAKEHHHTCLIDQYLPSPKCYLMQSVTSQEMDWLTQHEAFQFCHIFIIPSVKLSVLLILKRERADSCTF